MQIAVMPQQRREMWVRMMIHSKSLRLRVPSNRQVLYFKPPRQHTPKRYRILGVKP